MIWYDMYWYVIYMNGLLSSPNPAVPLPGELGVNPIEDMQQNTEAQPGSAPMDSPNGNGISTTSGLSDLSVWP